MKWTGLLMFMLIFALGLTFSRCGNKGDFIDTVAYPIAPAVNKIKITDKYYNKKVQLKTRLFYRAGGNRRAWLKKRKPEKMFQAFVDEIKASEQFGFEPEDYRIQELETAVSALYDNRERTDADISNLDIRITASFFLFTTHLLEGRVRYPGAREFHWERSMPLENDIVLLMKMESASDLRKELEALHPDSDQYTKLQKALKAYREREPADTLPSLEASAIRVEPGQSHEDIPLVRQRLALVDQETGWGSHSDVPDVYDEKLAEEVREFQIRHGIEADRRLSQETIRLLNMPVRERSNLIALNLERLRWRPHIRGEKDELVINVPEYMLRVYRNGEEKMKMRVVLGAEYTPTPVFQDTLKYIVFSPTWIVPRSIFEAEFYPKLRDDPEHFSPERFRFLKEGKEIDPREEDWDDKDFDSSKYSVVENPGEVNSLGNVKFIMPNDFSVYLHDTPADQLFSRESRALSHGCIRLEEPAKLAAYLLSDEKGWNDKRIREAMQANEPEKVDLERPYPVYIVYRTAWVDEGDRVHFREDIYGHDRRQLAYLQ